MKLKILRLDKGLPLPKYAKPGDSGLDIHAREDVTIFSGQRVCLSTGIAVAPPQGYEVQIRPRSGHTLDGIDVKLGTIDQPYRGELGVIVHNCKYTAVEIKRGERIAQIAVCPVLRPGVEEVWELDQTERGAGGFGHTGRGY